ncbi:hypothetical protein F4811DRAFT_519777 [Daldinia bambusicola]|nr:hypothetical protein F4811DRAFT_519777 [Daldinia bambusicola]
MVQAVLERMRARPSGIIVSISSLAAKENVPTTVLYSASKAESLGAEVSEFGVSVLLLTSLQCYFLGITRAGPSRGFDMSCLPRAASNSGDS